MKKIYKILFFTFIFLFFVFINTAQANSISSINMDIYVDKSGNAYVTEVWNCNVTQGTESYHPYYNLGNSKITNLTVSENGRTYTTLSSWNTSASFDSKAYKCGINYISNGLELCWGISSYGSHSYTVKYTITNFVSQLTDSQMIYWTLIPYDFSNPIGEAYIKIYSDFDYDFDTPVWGYGKYGGTCYVYDGYIEMGSDGKLDSDEYMTILAKFPLGTFNTTNKLDYDFNHYFEMAEDGAVHYNKSNGSKISNIISIIISVLFIVPFIIAIIYCIAAAGNNKLDFGETGNKVPKDVPLFRDIPCRGDIFRAYFIAYNYNLMKKKTDFLGAILLKWLKENKIKIEKQEVGKIFKKEDTCIVLDNTSTFENNLEQELHSMFYTASKDGILENKEFERWCSSNYSKILNWFDKILDYEQDILVKEGKIVRQEFKKIGFKGHKYIVDSSLMEEAKELKGLKLFLEDFTLMDKREAIEVTLFEYYMIFAQILGIAKKVASQFKKLYPDIIENYNYDYDDILLIHTISNSGISKAESARSRAQSYSSGGRRIFFRWRPEVALLVAGGGGRRIPLKFNFYFVFSGRCGHRPLLLFILKKVLLLPIILHQEFQVFRTNIAVTTLSPI